MVHLQGAWFGHLPGRSLLVLETDRAIGVAFDPSLPRELFALTLRSLDSESLRKALHEQIPPGHAHIRTVKVLQEEGGSRLELAFGPDMKVNIFRLHPTEGHGHRLVLDLRPREDSHTLRTDPLPLAIASGTVARTRVPVRLGRHPGPWPETRPDHPPPAPEPVREERSAPATEEVPAERPESEPAPAPGVNPVLQAGNGVEQIWLDVTLNNQPGSEIVLAMHQADGNLLLAQEDLQRWRLQPPPDGAQTHLGQAYFPLAALGIDFQLDLRGLTLNLEAPAELFDETLLNASAGGRAAATPSSAPGAFLNYDLSAGRADHGGVTANGLFEFGAFNRWGSGTSSFLAREEPSGDRSIIRLDTQWRRDDPETMRSLLIGDAISRGTAWSGAVRFGGLQWGSNFSTQPELVTMPMLDLAGEAVLPSTVDLYVNDALRLRQEVPPGPFSIRDIPAVSGRGEARLVIRDILGREQVISRNFFSSPQFLRKGLLEFSQELGLVRESYGQESNDYGELMASSTHRLGVSDRFTAEAHGQFLREQQTLGMGGVWQLPWSGLLHSSLAASHADGGTGQLAIIGMQQQGRHFSFGFDAQLASEHFARLGAPPGEDAIPARQVQAFARLAGVNAGSLSLAYTRQDYRTREDLEFINASYSLGLASLGHLNLSAVHFLSSGETRFNLHFTLPLGDASASLSAGKSGGGSNAGIQVQRSLPAGAGFGYRLQAGLGGDALRQGSLAYQNDYGLWQIQAAQGAGETNFLGQASGAFALMDGDVFASRRISDSFGLVQVPGFADVRIYADNQEVARTDRHGNALVPRLRAYQNNRIRIEQADLPLDAGVNVLEQQARPYYRSGVILGFDVERSRDAFFRIVLDDGQPLPTGAVLQLENGERFPVGLRGEAFLTDLQPSNVVRAFWQGQSCTFILDVPESSDPILDLGSVNCRGVSP